MGDIVYVELPEEGEELERGRGLRGSSNRSRPTADLYAPLSGKVIELNTPLEDAPRSSTKIPTSTAGDDPPVHRRPLSEIDALNGPGRPTRPLSRRSRRSQPGSGRPPLRRDLMNSLLAGPGLTLAMEGH